MAKVKRIIRKAPGQRQGDFFDESQWPVTIAMVLLGAFLIGVTSAYLPFSGVVWYRSAAFSILAILLVIVGFLVGFRYVDNRVIRRTMQLSVVLCALFHVALVVYMQETKIFAMLFDSAVVEREVIESRTPKKVAEYRPQEMIPDEDNTPKDFEKPLETETPEPEDNPTPVKKPVETVVQSQPKVQAIPVVEPEVTTKPNIVKREEVEQSAPKQAEQTSKLSKQVRPSEMKTSNQAELPKMAERVVGEEAKPKSAAVEKQLAQSTTSRSADVAESMTKVADIATIARKADKPSERPADASVPTLKRQLASPTQTPRAMADLADAPSQTQKTDDTAIRPATTLAMKRQTESPEVNPTTPREPTLDPSTRPDAKMERRESPAETAATLAQNPAPVNNQRAKLTERPDAATMAAIPKDSANKTPGTAATEATAASSAIKKTAAAQVAAERMADVPSAAPSTPQTNRPSAKIVSSSQTESPVLQPSEKVVTKTQKGGAPSLPAATQVDVAAAAPSTNTSSDTPSPASSAVQKQQVAAAEKGTVAGEPAAQQMAAANATLTESRPSTRRQTSAAPPRSDDTPAATAQAGPTVPGAKSTAAQVANIATRVGDVPTNTGPSVQTDAVPGPSKAIVRRQEGASSADAARTQNAAEVATAASTTQLARTSGAARANSASIPTLSPDGASGSSPRRAVAAATNPTSPSQLDSPAVAIANAGSGDVGAPSARLALNRSLAGTAGVGRSPNMENASPGATGEAQVASVAARRAEATQQAPDGAALTPSAPANTARARSESLAATSSQQVQMNDLATQAGSNNPSELTASSSAALTRADSNARKGNSTGAAGAADIDFGPTQMVAESGSGRAAGGGQAELNFDTQSPLLARKSTTGGAPAMSLAGAAVSDQVAAPMGNDGGTPTQVAASPMAIAANRTTAGGNNAVSGGPSKAEAVGPLTEVNGAALAGRAELSRADNSAGTNAPNGGGEAGSVDQKATATQVTRQASGGAPQVAISGPKIAEMAVSPQGNGGDAGGPSAAEAAIDASAIAAAKQSIAGGAPIGGAPVEAGSAMESGTSSGGELIGSLAITRAEAADGALGPAVIGGGTNKPAKAAAGASMIAPTTAETIELAGQPASSGSNEGSLIEANGGLTGRLATGAANAPESGTAGAMAGEQVLDGSTTGLVGRGNEKRQASTSNEEGPAIADATTGGTQARAGLAMAAGASGLMADVSDIGPNSAVDQAAMDHMLGGLDEASPMARSSGDDSLKVEIAAQEGPGGLGNNLTPEVGIKTRQARVDSDAVQVGSARFVKSTVGGLPSFSAGSSIPTAGFAARTARKRGDMPKGGRGRPDPQTEEAVELGLAFLARNQNPEGNWSLQGFDEAAAGTTTEQQYLLVSETGATALSLLAFQGAGYSHRDHQYKETVGRGLDYLLRNQKEDGDLFVALDDESNKSVWLYSHALATLALCEAYGMTQDPELREPAQKAVDFILSSQSKTYGGWRYAPGVGSDTSVSGWMLMAMKSARLANLNVPKENFDRVVRWLDVAQKSDAEQYLFRYNPYAPDTDTQRHGRFTSKTMTSVGLLMRLHTGWRRDNPAMVQGAEYLRENLPTLGTTREPQRDTYYWYYSTQVMFHMDGKYWQDWKNSLQPLLRDSQVRSGNFAGSWNPRLPVADRWAPHAGRLYVTTMNLLSLEVEYRHLPLYEDTKQ